MFPFANQFRNKGTCPIEHQQSYGNSLGFKDFFRSCMRNKTTEQDIRAMCCISDQDTLV